MTDSSKSSSGLSDLSGILDNYDAAWQAKEIVEIHRQLIAAKTSPEILSELVMIDLEYRWQFSGEDCVRNDRQLPPRPRVEDYLEQFDTLGSATEAPLALLAAEYRVRHRFGDAPTIEPYVARFANADGIRQTLQRLDDEMRKLYFSIGASEDSRETRRVPYEFMLGRQAIGEPQPTSLHAKRRRYKLIATPLENTAVSREQLMVKYNGGSKVDILNVSAETSVIVGKHRVAPSVKVTLPLPVDVSVGTLQIQILST